MKRSNRLVLLVGVFLAIIAFVAVLFLRPGGGPTPNNAPPTTAATVIATQDIALGARITAEMVRPEEKPLAGRDVDAFGDVSQVLGKTVREPVVAGAAITARTLSGGTGQILDIRVPAGRRAMTVQVDQVTGVGTVIKTGDYVDMVVGFPPDAFPVITTNPVDDSFTVVSGLNARSVKVLLQGMQVLGTLLPPPPAQAQGQEGQPAQGETGTALLPGQQEIVALSVDAQQAEVIKFAQISGEGAISLILRSSDDFVDPLTGVPIDPAPLPDPTTGIILKSLVDRYGVLPPELIETVLPAQARR